MKRYVLALMLLAGGSWGDTTGVVKLRPVGPEISRSEWESDYAIYILGGAEGDLPIWSATSGTLSRLARGSAGQVLTATSTSIGWAAATGGTGGGTSDASTFTQINVQYIYGHNRGNVTMLTGGGEYLNVMGSMVTSGALYANSIDALDLSNFRWRYVDRWSTRWRAITSGTVACSDTALMAPGVPLRWYDNGYRYGVVLAVTAGTSFSLAGAPFNLGAMDLRAGTPEMVRQIDFFVAGAYGDGANDLLENDMSTYFRWPLTPARCVAIYARHKTNAGTTQPKVNLKVNGSAVSNNDSSNGVQCSSGAWVANPATAINVSNYDVQYGEAVEVTCTVAGVGTQAQGLTMSTVWVME
ncbi:MAG: hypothetical protein ABFD89_28365 [Bryobacteraceae bacterium]